MSGMQQMMTAALAAEPGVPDLLDRLCGDTGRSPLVRLTCKGRERRTQRHDTGGTVRFKRTGDGWTLAGGRDSVAMPGVDSDGRVTVQVQCTVCGTPKLRAGREALEPILGTLVAWERRRDELAAQGITDPGTVRVAWH
ncbi:hypothetical protein [Brachybacterium squillarum]|uniref:hypothetical protein n=1 Tax=Brachybacterium squillarum TaxID=661979 RepID=UPI0002629A39|nr:hypothetical protein [Brachybacterium squillarum]